MLGALQICTVSQKQTLSAHCGGNGRGWEDSHVGGQNPTSRALWGLGGSDLPGARPLEAGASSSGRAAPRVLRLTRYWLGS